MIEAREGCLISVSINVKICIRLLISTRIYALKSDKSETS